MYPSVTLADKMCTGPAADGSSGWSLHPHPCLSVSVAHILASVSLRVDSGTPHHWRAHIVNLLHGSVFISTFNTEVYHKASDSTRGGGVAKNQQKMSKLWELWLENLRASWASYPRHIMLIYPKRAVTSEGKCISMIKYGTYYMTLELTQKLKCTFYNHR